MLNPWRIASTHEDLFMQRYALLMNMSLKLTGNDKERAEDLVHDAFVQFTLSRPELGVIVNLEGYLYAMLRNMHLSNVRRAVRRPSVSYSVLEYDSAEAGLRTMDSHMMVTARDQLRAICSYACVRKETSRAGGVLILRFFHGYYPGEIAQVMRSPRRSVDDWILIARREARLHLEEPRRLSLIRDSLPGDIGQTIESGRTTGDFLAALRQAIFRTRRGVCLSSEELQATYCGPGGEPVSTTLLAHIVSCPRCLDEVNRLLGLPPLSERYPTDMLGPDPRNRDGENGCRRRARQVSEHSPKELHLSVNGFVLGSQSISSEISEQAISINIAEKLGFVEVFSDQGVRLLFTPVEPPPDGPITQRAEIELSEGRSLGVELAFSDSWPRLRARYIDPSLRSVPQDATANELVPAADEIKPISATVLARFRSAMGSLGLWLTPGTVTAVMTVLLIAALVAHRMTSTPTLAAELLSRAVATEDGSLWKPDVVVHRTIDLEQRHPETGRVLGRQRIEIWSGLDNASKARRVYDERGELLAGEWAEADSRTIYRRGSESRVVPPEYDKRGLLSAENIWRLEPTATDFSSLIQQTDEAAVEEKPRGYLVVYGRQGDLDQSPGLLRATLLLRRGDLRPLEQTLLLRDARGLQEYRFVVNRVEDLSSAAVPAAVFKPDVEATGAVPDRTGPAREIEAASPISQPGGLASVEFARLEVEALSRLHHIGSCLREATGLSRTTEGSLRIHTIVETEKRKMEVLDALSSLANNPGVRIEVDTIAEAERREVTPNFAPRIPRRIGISRGRIPVHDDVKAYLSASGMSASEANIDQEVARFARGVMERSRRALLHAGALVRHVEEFSRVNPGGLGPDDLAKRHAVVAEHSVAFEQEVRRLQSELKPIFFTQPSGTERNDFGGLGGTQAVRRLFEMASSQEKAVRMAFALSPDDEDLFIRSGEFWLLLKDCEALAVLIRSLQ